MTAPTEATQSTWRLIGRLLRDYVRPHRRSLALSAVAMIVAALATGSQAWLIQPALDDVLIKGDRAMLLLIPGAIVLASVVKGLSGYGQAVLMNRACHRIVATMQFDLYAHLLRADLAFFHDRPTGELTQRITNDMNYVRSAINRSLIGMARDSFLVVVLIANMFYQSWQLSLLSFAAFPIALWPIVHNGRRMRRVARDTQAQIGELAAHLDGGYSGIRRVKAYSMEAHEAARARGVIDRVRALTLKADMLRARMNPIMELLGAAAVAGAILYGGRLVIDDSMTAGQFSSFMASLLIAYQPVRSLANLNAVLQEGMAASVRFFAMLDMRPAIFDASGAQPLKITAGAVQFTDVSFVYGGRSEGAVRDVTIAVPAGKKVAIVGASGAGKSTILNLILRLFDVDTGRVEIDGQDVRAVTLDSLRRSIGLVSQDPGLFDATIRANIAYGRPDADEAAIRAAAQAADADAFIAALPQGYDTRVGEVGVKLSGGQRQRVAIARAMLKNAPILLLDEATSALDTQTERQVQEALTRLMAGRTTIVVAHRLTTVADADLIHVMDAGHVVESGTHRELMARRGTYARLYEREAGETVQPLPRARA